jgi:hypothetical protein
METKNTINEFFEFINGVAERMNLTLLDHAWSVLSVAELELTQLALLLITP